VHAAPELDAADGFCLDLAEFRADLRIASTDPRMPPEFFLDYRTGVLAVRALVEDEVAFCAVVEQSRDFDPAAFADFARAGDVREWLPPAPRSFGTCLYKPHGPPAYYSDSVSQSIRPD